jgi:hypothetical protein
MLLLKFAQRGLELLDEGLKTVGEGRAQRIAIDVRKLAPETAEQNGVAVRTRSVSRVGKHDVIHPSHLSERHRTETGFSPTAKDSRPARS